MTQISADIKAGDRTQRVRSQ